MLLVVERRDRRQRKKYKTVARENKKNTQISFLIKFQDTCNITYWVTLFWFLW